MESTAERMAEAAARIEMTELEVLRLLRRFFVAADSMLLAPAIPPRKEEAIRLAHHAHLPLFEPVLGVYDDTLFGPGAERFVVTARRLCWKNEGGPAQSLEWADIPPSFLHADGNRLFVANETIVLTRHDGLVIDAALAAFHILALSARAASQARPISRY